MLEVDFKHATRRDGETLAWFIGAEALPTVRAERRIVGGVAMPWQMFIRSATGVTVERAQALALAMNEAADMVGRN